jgi:hypothetical protein
MSVGMGVAVGDGVGEGLGEGEGDASLGNSTVLILKVALAG